MPEAAREHPKHVSRIRRILGVFGPGLITGAADDDPSGIATYSQTGALFGFGQLWTALYQLPLLLAVQEACGRIGAVTGKGLAGVGADNANTARLRCQIYVLPSLEDEQIALHTSALLKAGAHSND